jgi:methyl-accepting chemotaxis protein
MYAGVPCDIGFVQIGYGADPLAEAKALADMSNIASDRHVGETGHVIVLDADKTIISGEDGCIGLSAAEAGIDMTALTDSGGIVRAVIYGEPSTCLYAQHGDYGIIAAITDEEIYFSRNVFAYEIAFMEIVLFAVIFVLIFLLLKRLVVDNVHKINRSLARITNGDLNEAVDVRESEEFVSLSNDINSTVDTLKRI